MDCRRGEVGIETKDGVAAGITIFTGDVPPGSPVLVCMPAMGVAAKFYEPLAEPMVKEGWHLITADLRGNGLSSLRAARGVSFGFHEMVAYDWPAVMETAKALFPGSPLYLLGHSLGGQLSALYLAANPGTGSGLVLVAAPSVHYRGWGFPLNLAVLAGTQSACLIARALGYFPGRRIGFGGTEARGVICDWAHTGRTGRYEPAGSAVDYEGLLGEMELPVLAVSFEVDLLAPERAVANFCAKMKRCRITHHHLWDEDLGHLQWMRNPRPVIERIREWLQKEG
ncbi:MAG TPA: alpha/beta fold hydrolase [Syntrophales bacterium]|jgi:predicted alpha/beta hydrolase|nr:alpha/beta fold hydrolase [Syntrophales bacterium]